RKLPNIFAVLYCLSFLVQQKPSTEWSGCLAPEAEFILFQHAEHFGLGQVHTAMCRWICLAKKYRRRPIQCRLLDEQLKALLATWTDKSLSHDQVGRCLIMLNCLPPTTHSKRKMTHHYFSIVSRVFTSNETV
ncbi:hypothetical protein FGIG_05139, partial [Fasciola gigantica]